MTFKEVPHGNMYKAGLAYAKAQGLDESEYELFAEALSAEHWNGCMMDIDSMFNFAEVMDDTKIRHHEEPVDDFIVGQVCKAGLFPTDIVSKENLPSHFYGKEVEIRLKEVVPPAPMKTEYTCLNKVEDCMYWSNLGRIPFANLKYNGTAHSLIFEGLKPFVGKKVEITIEEVE
jgi:hypothetical protein